MQGRLARNTARNALFWEIDGVSADRRRFKQVSSGGLTPLTVCQTIRTVRLSLVFWVLPCSK